MHPEIKKYWEDQGLLISAYEYVVSTTLRSWEASLSSNGSTLVWYLAEELTDHTILYYGLPGINCLAGISEVEALRIIKLKAFI